MVSTTRMPKIDRADVATAILALTPALAAAASLLLSAWLASALPARADAAPTGDVKAVLAR